MLAACADDGLLEECEEKVLTLAKSKGIKSDECRAVLLDVLTHDGSWREWAPPEAGS